MVQAAIVAVFILGYLAVTVEHKIHISKTATVLMLAAACWVLLGFQGGEVVPSLGEHVENIAQILIFLIGAMTIVQLIDAHNGFQAVTDILKTRDKRKLLWLVSTITFFLSAVLDNLTTAIVMVSITQRLLDDREDRLIFAGMVIISANAGGAWTPIGDITTTMLWIGERISTARIMSRVFIPSVVSVLVPLVYFSLVMKNEPLANKGTARPVMEPGALWILWLGVGALVFVPIFRAMTDLPPFMGMLLGVGFLWVVTDLLHKDRPHLRVPHVLGRIDLASVLFFLGILLAVAALESAGVLKELAVWLDLHLRNKDLIDTALGLLSAIVDNVPLTAAAMGMYDLNTFPMDSKIWELLAYAVGTGGSILIIGSAAGVVVMGMEKITFSWYLRKFSLPAMLGYFAGIVAYLAVYRVVG